MGSSHRGPDPRFFPLFPRGHYNLCAATFNADRFRPHPRKGTFGLLTKDCHVVKMTTDVCGEGK